MNVFEGHGNVFEGHGEVNCIQHMNFSYLLLAQRLIREDKDSAGFRLGLNESNINLLENLTPAQLIKLSSTNQLICRLRFEHDMVIDCLTKDSRIDALQLIHTEIILSTDFLDSSSSSVSSVCTR